MDASQLSIDGRQIYAAEADRLRQLGWQERKPRLLPDLTLGEWDSTCEVSRRDGTIRSVQYRVVYWRDYPWRKPTIWPVAPRYERTLHLSAPSTDDERKYAEKAALGDRLCIWDDYIGWDPELAEQEVPERICGWFDHAENGWSGSEGRILDPERYFMDRSSTLFAANGLADLKKPLGTVCIAASDRLGLIKSVDGRPCSGYVTAAAALRLTPKVEVTAPYILLARQPATPIFDTLRGLRAEATRQGLDGNRLIQHLRNHIVVIAPVQGHRKGSKNKQQRHGKYRWPKGQPPHLYQRSTGGEMQLRFLLNDLALM